MTPLVRGFAVGWAFLALVVLGFVDQPLVRWLIVVPVLVFGPGMVAARFVSPDDGRFRPTIALAAGLACLVLVSEVFALGDFFSVESVAAVLSALTVVGALVVPSRSPVASVLPPRRPIDPTSMAARRLRLAAPAGAAVDSGPAAAGAGGGATGLAAGAARAIAARLAWPTPRLPIDEPDDLDDLVDLGEVGDQTDPASDGEVEPPVPTPVYAVISPTLGVLAKVSP